MSQTDHKKNWRGLRLTGVIAIVLALVVVVHGVILRAQESKRLHDWTEAQAIPSVAVVSPSPKSGHVDLELPGRLEAYSRAPIYARVSGYVKDWKADIGAKVKAGQLLAEIQTPDLDQQLLQARADLGTAEANEALARTTAQRWQKLLQSGLVARQDVDEKTGDLAAKQAMVKSAQANVARLVAMKGFTRIVAPFDGVVTARNVDVGALVNAGSSAGQALFVVSDIKRLRVYVNVPQSDVPSVPSGTRATLSVPDHPNATYSASIEASAQSVDAASGTTLMQLLVDNASGDLLPGGYATVHLQLAGARNSLSVPASALIFDARGLSVATVASDDRVAIKPVRIARDLGRVVELESGLASNDRVIANPPDGISNGARVRVVGNDADGAPPHAANNAKQG